jgi:alanine dehydrogenase
MTNSNDSSSSLIRNQLLPKEEMLETGKPKMKLKIGVPRENQKIENRVALTPESIEILVNKGHEVFVESDAGKQASYSNKKYSDHGAIVVADKSEVYRCDIILKVAPMTIEEADLLTSAQLIISSLHFNENLEGYIKKLMEKKATAIAFENLKDDDNLYTIDRTMSEISGATAILIAAEYLSNIHEGKGVYLGGITGITPAEVVIIGAGTTGEYAAKAAIGLGAQVKVFDNSNIKLRKLQNNIGQRVFTSVIHNKVLEKALSSADVVIGALPPHEIGMKYIVSEKMIKKMKEGSVVIDLTIDHGGCFETSECRTHQNPVFKKFGVIHYCVPNIPSRVARTASIALSNVFVPLLLSIDEYGGIKYLLQNDMGVRHSVYLYNGILTNLFIGEKLGIPSKDITLLMAAF